MVGWFKRSKTVSQTPLTPLLCNQGKHIVRLSDLFLGGGVGRTEHWAPAGEDREAPTSGQQAHSSEHLAPAAYTMKASDQ